MPRRPLPVPVPPRVVSPDQGVDFNRFFDQFPLDSAISLYLSNLDMDELMNNLRMAVTPLADVPYTSRAETLRCRAAVRSELAMLDHAFSDIEARGVKVGHLRGDVRDARVRLEARIREDNAWYSASSSPASSQSSSRTSSFSSSRSSLSLASPPSSSHRRRGSEPAAYAPIPTPYGVAAQVPPARRSSTGSPLSPAIRTQLRAEHAYYAASASPPSRHIVSTRPRF